MRHEIVKTLFGGHKIKFDCPTCSEHLTSPLSDAGSADRCPACLATFLVPGVEQYEELLRSQAEAKEAKRIAKEEAAKREQEQWEQQRKAEKQARLEAERKAKEQLQKQKPVKLTDQELLERILIETQETNSLLRPVSALAWVIVILLILQLLGSIIVAAGSSV